MVMPQPREAKNEPWYWWDYTEATVASNVHRRGPKGVMRVEIAKRLRDVPHGDEVFDDSIPTLDQWKRHLTASYPHLVNPDAFRTDETVRLLNQLDEWFEHLEEADRYRNSQRTASESIYAIERINQLLLDCNTPEAKKAVTDARYKLARRRAKYKPKKPKQAPLDRTVCQSAGKDQLEKMQRKYDQMRERSPDHPMLPGLKQNIENLKRQIAPKGYL